MSFFKREPSDFLPNAVILGTYSGVKLLSDLQLVIHEQLATIKKRRFLEKGAPCSHCRSGQMPDAQDLKIHF
jgi:hypothetical protein